MLRKNRKEEVLTSIDELITLLTLLKIKVDSLEDSKSLAYIAFVLSLGRFAISSLHRELMIEEVKSKKEEGSELEGGGKEKMKRRFDLS